LIAPKGATQELCPGSYSLILEEKIRMLPCVKEGNRRSGTSKIPALIRKVQPVNEFTI
jgi:hypothetical protein